jgi:hypothetical protein
MKSSFSPPRKTASPPFPSHAGPQLVSLHLPEHLQGGAPSDGLHGGLNDFWRYLPQWFYIFCQCSQYQLNVSEIIPGYTEPSMVAGKQSGRNHVHHARIQKASKNPQAQLMDVELCNSMNLFSPSMGYPTSGEQIRKEAKRVRRRSEAT